MNLRNTKAVTVTMAVGSVLLVGLPLQQVLADPSVSVGNVTVSGGTPWNSTIAICATDSSDLKVSASVTPTYDTGSDPTTKTVDTKCNTGNNWCGTNNSTNKCQRVATTTSVAVSNQSVSATASGSPSSIYGALTGTSPDGGIFSGNYSVPNGSLTDGAQNVTVSATVSDDVTTTTTTTTSYWNATSGNSCSGTQLSSSTVGPTPNTVTNGGSGSKTLTKAYVLDVVPPTLAVRVPHPDPFQVIDVVQGTDGNVNTSSDGGSAGTSFTLTDTATGSSATYSTPPTIDNYNSSNDGIAPHKENVLAIKFACDAPLGAYDVSAKLSSPD